MTCDNASGAKLDTVANNNNNNVIHQNGRKLNGLSNGSGGVSAKRSEAPVIVDEEALETRKSLMILAVIFATGLLALFYIYNNFPRMDE
jgi:hypothetical protein